MKHAFIVPLIGGQALGQEKAFNSKPDYLLSYSPFAANDSHIVNYYGKDVPYIQLDKGGRVPHKVDVVGTTCPCAGLSSLSGHASPDAAANEWMFTTTKFVLSEMKPQVLWGENAPGFAGKVGAPVVSKLREIARENGYGMSIYRTRSLLHGLCQVRERSFYFFWKGNEIPALNWFNRGEPTSVEQTLAKIPKRATQQDVTNPQIPSKDDPFYRYVLEELEGGISHKEFYDIIPKTTEVMDWIEYRQRPYTQVAKWMRKQKLERLAKRCESIHKKLEAGGNIMRRMSTIPKGHMGAFVAHLPTKLTHPSEDRYITVREALSIMGMPYDFKLLEPKKFLNHVCQNVPVGTATDMASEIKAALNGERKMIKTDMLRQYNANQVIMLDYDKDGANTHSLETFM